MNRKAYILALTILIASACTGVKVEETPASVVNVTCTADWSGTASVPSYTFDFAAARTLKSVHYYQDGVYTNRGEEDSFQMEPGEYEALFMCSTPQDAYQVENKDTFLDESESSLGVLTARTPSMSHADFVLKFAECTPILVEYYDILHPVAPLYIGTVRQQLQANGTVQNLSFKPRPVFQKVTFRITITPGDNTMEPTRVVANLTGTPLRVQMLSGNVDASELGQTAFELTHVEGDVWEGTVQILGIKVSEDAELAVGPGIMRLYVRYGTVVSAVINKVLNLKPYLDAQPLLRYADDGEYYSSVAPEARFVIEDPLYLKPSGTEHAGEEPISPWKDPEDGDVHDILDGYDDDENA